MSYQKSGARSEEERETARVGQALRALPLELVVLLDVKQIRDAFGIRLGYQSIRKLRNDFIQAMEGEMKKGDRHKPEAIGNQIALERIARIITKAYPHLGDGEKIATEDALQMIYRELSQYDPAIIKRNERRALPKQRPSASSAPRAVATES